MNKKKIYIIIITAIIIVGLVGLYFIKLNKDNKNQNSQISNVSIEKINSENKKYMDSVINQSKNFNEIKIDFEKTDRKIIYATDYKMNLTLDIDKKLLSGNSKVKIKNNTNDETDHIILRNYSATALKNKGNSFLSNFKDESGNTLNSLVEDDESIIKVELSNKLKPNEEITITFDFQTDIPKTKNRFGYVEYDNNLIFQLSFCFPSLSIYENGEWNKNPFILSGAEPNYTTVSNYSVCINVPNDYVVIATGTETNDKNNNYTITGNNLREFAMVVGNNIEKNTATYNGIEINNYYYDYSGNKKYNDYSLKIAVESFELYSNLIGEYPYEELDMVSVFMETAMEYSGLLMIGYPDCSPEDLKNLDEGKRYDHIESHIPHEVAHQWFYSVIGNDPYNEPWLDEAFAEFFEGFVFPISGLNVIEKIELEKDKNTGVPIQRYTDFYRIKNSMLEQIPINKFINLPYDSYDKDDYSHYVYQSGAFFLFELEQTMGEEKFFSMLQNYYKKYKFSEVTTKDFIDFIRIYDSSEETDKIINKYVALD